MNPIDPIRLASLDDIVGLPESGPVYGSYGPASSYRPYHWEMPWIETPQPTERRLEEPPPEPERLPRYEDALPYELIARAMRDFND